MSFQSLADAFAYVQACEDMTSNEVLVLLALANHVNKHQAVAYPSVASLQRVTKLSRRAIQYALRALEERNALQAILEPSRHGVTTYRLLIPRSCHSPESKRTIDSPKFTRAPHAPPRAPGAPQPIIEPVKREKRAETDRKDLKEGLLRMGIGPGSFIWAYALNGHEMPSTDIDAKGTLNR